MFDTKQQLIVRLLELETESKTRGPRNEFFRELGRVSKVVRQKKRFRNQVSGKKTIVSRERILYKYLNELFDTTHCQLRTPRSFKRKHMHTIVCLWKEQGLTINTQRTYFSYFTSMVSWTSRKPEMVLGKLDDYFHKKIAKRSAATKVDKMWAPTEQEVVSDLYKILEEDWYVGLMMICCYLFGMRRAEAIHFRPRTCIDLEKNVIKLHRILDAPKNGRERFIPLKTEEQRVFARFIYSIPQRDYDRLAPVARDEGYWSRRIDYVLNAKLGFNRNSFKTPHCLRHTYANEQFIRESNIATPVSAIAFLRLVLETDSTKGGKKEITQNDKDSLTQWIKATTRTGAEHEEVIRALSNALGHSRKHIIQSYCGAPAKVNEMVDILLEDMGIEIVASAEVEKMEGRDAT